jgi:hypothetical protein
MMTSGKGLMSKQNGRKPKMWLKYLGHEENTSESYSVSTTTEVYYKRWYQLPHPLNLSASFNMVQMIIQAGLSYRTECGHVSNKLWWRQNTVRCDWVVPSQITQIANAILGRAAVSSSNSSSKHVLEVSRVASSPGQ